jgi:hypothetical protein
LKDKNALLKVLITITSVLIYFEPFFLRSKLFQQFQNSSKKRKSTNRIEFELTLIKSFSENQSNNFMICIIFLTFLANGSLFNLISLKD